MFRHRPHPTDPDKMYFDRMILIVFPKGGYSRAKAGAVDLFVELGDGSIDGRLSIIFIVMASSPQVSCWIRMRRVLLACRKACTHVG